MDPVAPTKAARETYDLIFGAYKRHEGRRRLVMRGGQLVEGNARVADNDVMVSMALGCPDPREQQKRIARYAAMGIEARYRKTGELEYSGGYQAQKRLAAEHGLEVG